MPKRETTMTVSRHSTARALRTTSWLAIGLAVVLPWLGYATWHLYTRTVVR